VHQPHSGFKPIALQNQGKIQAVMKHEVLRIWGWSGAFKGKLGSKTARGPFEAMMLKLRPIHTADQMVLFSQEAGEACPAFFQELHQPG
jgi:hypothetical protein